MFNAQFSMFNAHLNESKNEELIKLFDKALSILKLIALDHASFSYLNIES